MEDYIFIIIAIVLSILGAVNKGKKKENAGAVTNEGVSGQPNSFFKHFLDDDFLGQPEVKPAPVYTASQPKAKTPKIKKTMGHTPFLPGESRVRRIRERTFISKKVEIIQNKPISSKPKVSREIMKGFSLKKAVVYSEIIEKRY